MRKVYLRLEADTDISVYRNTTSDGTNYWNLRNRDNEMCVVRHAYLCKSIARGVYLVDPGSGFIRDKLLTSDEYTNVN